ncbi:unnamed protein product [Ilex paraguariensis]|uniref:Uncharacterized protein n=1 Tax=Ilex paraguariensis TaxID=185542 RepID=A0ABC8SA10_9AQUA
MALPSFLVFFILSNLVVVNSAQERKQSHYNCPVSFPCGYLGLIGFPFTNMSRPECGLCTVDCGPWQPPNVQLETNGRWYEVKRMFQNDTVLVVDPESKLRLESRSCDSFYNNSNLPNTPSISYTFSPNLTLFKCIKNPEFAQKKDEYFNNSYLAYDDCPDFSIHYTYSYNRSMTPSNLPSYCSVIQLPANSRKDVDPSKPFQLLTSEFSLQLHVSKECSSCNLDGGQCKTVSGNQLQYDKGQGKSKLKLTLLIVGFAVGIVILVATFICFRRKFTRDQTPIQNSNHLQHSSISALQHHSSAA